MSKCNIASEKRLPMHALIVGGQGVGKSTLIHRVLQTLEVPVCGYVTRKEPHLRDPQLGDPIYIYEADQPQIQTKENLVGYCREQRPLVYGETFDRFGEKLKEIAEADKRVIDADEMGMEKNIAAVQKAPLILMDEIGVMERHSPAFCQAVLDLLDGDRPILAAVKYKDRPYLEQIRSHPRCRCFAITEENRDKLYEEVVKFVQEQIGSLK